MFENNLYSYSHGNITDILISRQDSYMRICITYTIENKEKTKRVKFRKLIYDEDIRIFKTVDFINEANKLASLIDKVPDYIPNSQTEMWMNLRLGKL